MNPEIVADLKEIQERNMYVKHDEFTPCKAGGYLNWLKLGIRPVLHSNYGLPCLREVGEFSCRFCGKSFEN